MKTPFEELWTIEELAVQVADALAGAQFGGVPSGRVRDVPDLRTIRYYTTLGLLDRPAAMRGRTAFYGRRHLMQLVAIKRLQAQGLALAEVQQRLVGQTDSVLECVALGSGRGDEAVPAPPLPRSAAHAPVRGRAEAGPQPDLGVPTSPACVSEPEAVRLAGDTALVLRPLRPLTDRDRRLIRMATAPLLELLRLHGLIGPEPSPQETHDERPGDAANR